MASSSASQIRVRRLREVTNGTLEAGNMLILPFESFNIDSPITREQGANVTSHRQPLDNPATDMQITGSAKSDVIYSDYDGMYEEGFANTFSSAGSMASTSIVAAASGNTLTRGGGAGSFVSEGFAVGDIVKISGYTTNGAVFYGLVSALSATVMTLRWPTLVDETASITIKHSGQLTLGTSMLTASYERLNMGTTKGKKNLGVGVSQIVWNYPHPNKLSQSFTLVGMSPTTRITAALANGSSAASGNPAYNSNNNIGDGLNPTRGLGFRINDALIPNVRFKNLTITVDNPLSAMGGLGALGPQDIALDGRFNVKLDIEAYRNHADAEALIDYAIDQTSVMKIGFGAVDNLGNVMYWYFHRVQPTDEKTSPVAQSGREMINMSLVGSYDSTHSAIRLARINL